MFFSLMDRMRATATDRGGEVVPDHVVETLARRRGRARTRGGGRAQGAAPARFHVRGVSPEPEKDDGGDQIPPVYAL